MTEDGDVTTNEPGAETSDDFSAEISELADAEEAAAIIEVSEPVRIAWPIVPTGIMSDLSPSDRDEVQAVIDDKLATLDADNEPTLGGSQHMILEVNDHLRLIYSKRNGGPNSEEHPGYSILTIARSPGQMFRFTQEALGR